MKRMLLLVLCVVLLLSAVACTEKTPSDTGTESKTETVTNKETSTPETPADDFHCVELEDGTLSVSYTGKDANVVVPEKIDGKTVTAIRNLGFETAKDCLCSVILPDTITSIGNAAFENCILLSSVNFPLSLKNIGTAAFSNCTSLKHIEIFSDCLNEYSWDAFFNSGLETVVLHEGVKMIPNNCFARTNIKSIVLPSTVEQIGSQAFGDCPHLESVVLNEGLTKIGDRAFSKTPKLKEIIIPATVSEITEMAFSACSTLEKVKFEGDAPIRYVYPPEEMPFDPIDVHYVIYFHPDAEGFTTPQWNGYDTELW